MKQKVVYIGFIIICIIVLTLAIVGYYHAQKQKPQNSTNNTKQSAVTENSISPISTGTGDIQNPGTWLRYIYNHEFSIAYPPYWNVIVDQDGNGISFMTTGFHQDDDFSMPYGNSSEVVYTVFGEQDTSDMKLQNGDQFPSDATSETMVVTSLKYIQIDGYKAVEFDYYPTDNTNFLRTRISVLKGNKMYRFNAVYSQDIGKQLFEEMMQTLKFTS